jgi:hypothetical protein
LKKLPADLGKPKRHGHRDRHGEILCRKIQDEEKVGFGSKADIAK